MHESEVADRHSVPEHPRWTLTRGIPMKVVPRIRKPLAPSLHRRRQKQNRIKNQIQNRKRDTESKIQKDQESGIADGLSLVLEDS